MWEEFLHADFAEMIEVWENICPIVWVFFCAKDNFQMIEVMAF